DGNKRLVDVRESGDDCLSVTLQELILRALLQIEIAEKLAAMKDRLGQAGSERIDRRFRPQQQLEESALIAALASERDARQELRTRILNVGIGGGELRLRLTDIGTLGNEF